MSSIYYQGQDQDPNPKYQIYAIAYERRRVSIPIWVSGKEVTMYDSPVVTHYIDPATGEIFEAKALRNDPEHWPAFPFGENVLLRQAILSSLRKEVRSFALFVLAFRNNRRGVTPSVGDLVKMYAVLHDQQAHNVRRYVKRLEEVGIIVGSSLLGPLFQFAGRKLKAREHIGEDAAASVRYLVMRMKNSSALDSSQTACEIREAA